MKKIKVEIENCYGISALNKEFDFTDNKSTQIIYAPNGVMKTSFANVFSDYCNNTNSKDLIFPERESKTVILDAISGEAIEQESVFVIRPYEKDFKSNKMSTLLVKEELRLEYEKIHESINIAKENLFIELKKASGIKGNIEQIFSESFEGIEKGVLFSLERLEDEINNEEDGHYSHIMYSKIFDKKVIAFLNTGDFKVQIKKYIEKYEELINESPFLRKDFNHYNASTVHKNLNDNGFFKAEHSINININGVKIEVLDNKEFGKMIEKEKEKILNESSLQIIFEKIDKKITNVELREFRDYLFENKDILPELVDLKFFSRKIWISYLKENTTLYNMLLEEYKNGQLEIKKILETAKNEETKWENVIEIFNRRFYVPYRLGIKNKEDTILKDEAPSIHYYFQGRIADVEEDLLIKILSQGERRALYLLNIIFEIESRKKQEINTLFIIDDIADSFDYKNKYAIIEYLKEISENEKFISIILTHNFDFFRTVQERVSGNSKYQNSFMAIKEKDYIKIEEVPYKYISNPFKNWKKNLNDDTKLLASVTFARNIAEYIGDNDNVSKLTSVLHIKPNTKNMKIKDLEDIYKTIFNDLNTLELKNSERNIYDLILQVAERICYSEAEVGLNLENKIVISIAIRLNAENFMIKKINNEEFVSKIKSNQTGKLFGEFKKVFPLDIKSIAFLEKVNLMTPENIHLNSFMFEPILDLSDYHLKQLYKDVLTLIAAEISIGEEFNASAQVAVTREHFDLN